MFLGAMFKILVLGNGDGDDDEAEDDSAEDSEDVEGALINVWPLKCFKALCCENKLKMNVNELVFFKNKLLIACIVKLICNVRPL
jgi:hypothetical protein